MQNDPPDFQFDRSKKELISRITELCGSIQQTSFKILLLDTTPIIPGFMVSIMGHIATQGHRIIDWLREPHLDNIDLIAHSTRSIFETCLIYRDLALNDGQFFMDRVKQEVMRDELDIIEGSLLRFEHEKDAPQEVRDRRDILLAQNLPKVRRVFDRAKDTNSEYQYKAFYKLLSKYSHPSLYLLVGDRRYVYSQDAMLILADRAAVYLEAANADYSQMASALLAQEKET